MRIKFCILAGGLILAAWHAKGQSIVGTWQLSDEKTCFQSEMKESETERELMKDMGATRTGVARIITFNKKGKGEEGVFSTGQKKGKDMTSFKYKVNAKELVLMDYKSGIMTQQLVIDELSASTLTVHNAMKDCEIKTFTRIK
jgi:hypothetical protein